MNEIIEKLGKAIIAKSALDIVDNTTTILSVTGEKYEKELGIINCIISLIISDNNPKKQKDDSDVNIDIASKNFLEKIRKFYDEDFKKIEFEIKEYNRINKF